MRCSGSVLRSVGVVQRQLARLTRPGQRSVMSPRREQTGAEDHARRRPFTGRRITWQRDAPATAAAPALHASQRTPAGGRPCAP